MREARKGSSEAPKGSQSLLFSQKRLHDERQRVQNEEELRLARHSEASKIFDLPGVRGAKLCPSRGHSLRPGRSLGVATACNCLQLPDLPSPLWGQREARASHGTVEGRRCWDLEVPHLFLSGTKSSTRVGSGQGHPRAPVNSEIHISGSVHSRSLSRADVLERTRLGRPRLAEVA